MIALALNVDSSVKWQTSTSNNNMTVDYAYVPPPGGRYAASEEASLATIRATTIIPDFEPADFHEFCGYNDQDEFNFYSKNDPMCEEIRPTHIINEDKAIVYARFNAGGGITSWLVWNRDFCYVKRRFLYRNLVIDSLPNGEKLDNSLNFHEVAIGFCTSLDENDPRCQSTEASHVRGEIKYAGYCFFKEKESDTHCRFVYVVNLDPKGWLPNKVVDIAAPQQAKVALQVKNNIEMIRASLRKKRERKNEAEAEVGVEAQAEVEREEEEAEIQPQGEEKSDS